MNDREELTADDRQQVPVRPETPLHSILEMIAKAVVNKLVSESDSERKMRRSKFPMKTRQDT